MIARANEHYCRGVVYESFLHDGQASFCSQQEAAPYSHEGFGTIKSKSDCKIHVGSVTVSFETSRAGGFRSSLVRIFLRYWWCFPRFPSSMNEDGSNYLRPVVITQQE